jgi:hypothetical protein
MSIWRGSQKNFKIQLKKLRANYGFFKILSYMSEPRTYSNIPFSGKSNEVRRSL